MNINIMYMPMFYRTPNCTFVNVGQFKTKFYRKPFFHLKGKENGSYSSLAS